MDVRFYFFKERTKMKKTLLIISTFLVSSAFAAPAMNVFTINTADPMGYMEWARASAPITNPPSNTASAGVCLPSGGSEEFGDMYFYSLYDSHADSLSGNYYDPEVAAEIAKIADKRTVSSIDHYSALTPVAEGVEVGMTYANYNINVYTKNPQRYIQEIAAYQATAQANGFEDVTLGAFLINTGDYTGQVMAVIQAPTSVRLGEFLDARNEAWNIDASEKFPKLRKLKRGFMMTCEVVYVR